MVYIPCLFSFLRPVSGSHKTLSQTCQRNDWVPVWWYARHTECLKYRPKNNLFMPLSSHFWNVFSLTTTYASPLTEITSIARDTKEACRTRRDASPLQVYSPTSVLRAMSSFQMPAHTSTVSLKRKSDVEYSSRKRQIVDTDEQGSHVNTGVGERYWMVQW